MTIFIQTSGYASQRLHQLWSCMTIHDTFVSMVSMSYSVGPLCISLKHAWLHPAGSRHNHTVPLGFVTMTKLLNHSAVSLAPSGPSIYCSCSLPTSLNGS